MNSQEESQTPKLSIVVATFRRPDQLSYLLDALQKQIACRKDFEIIVIDNELDFNHEVNDLCASTKYRDLHIRYIHEPKSGLSCARNRGAQEAHAELIAFLDDDCFHLQIG